MENPNYPNLRFFIFKEDGEGKPPYNDPPNLFVNYRIHLRIAFDSFNRLINTKEKLSTEPIPLVLIPSDCFEELAFSFRMETNEHC